ncbi:UBA/TS-N domain containing protein [Histomonas meleagridis]|uniref:UBA/TS-N domain containing protein n=1 Tax=Histomonas meleagridis TaxID=135588 RepID=UPI0035594911|nr:UBA/TS-N domain containing protein [Histomonas meleagridis]KAH0807149.1 UBA/TS-N domain containing protein [Histomonas meleagridis]
MNEEEESIEDNEEVIIGDDDDDFEIISEISKDVEPSRDFSKIYNDIQLFNSFCDIIKITGSDGKIKTTIPTIVLPASLQMVGGFHYSPTLLNISLELNGPEWSSGLKSLDVTHPLYKRNYIGRPLVESVIRKFFTPYYTRKQTYKSILFFKTNSNRPNLIFFGNFFRDNNSTATTPPVNYNSCHILFLIYEIIDAFLDLNDHCCICRKHLQISGIKPSICDSRLCSVAFEEIGVGNSVAQEIRRDPYAADWIFTIYGSAQGTKYCNPSPPTELVNVGYRLLGTLPSMEHIANTCRTDTDIIKTYGQDTLSFLRWLLLSNKSQIISLPNKLLIKEIPTKYQFMTIISDQNAEVEFQEKKKKNAGKSLYMWHGSGNDRWHSIIRNGLKNMSRVPGGVLHGTAYGEGIYFAKNSTMSFYYTQSGYNNYKNSKLPSKIMLIALCEVVPNNQLRDHGELYTLIDEKACVVRFVFVTEREFSFDPTKKKFNVPTLEDILDFQAQQASMK